MAKVVSESDTQSPALDDIMIAMDVVDTLRHDRRIVDRELNDETRRADLIRRLREIYRGQGIEVSEEILEEGVKALEEDRFTYTPPKGGLNTRLAVLYVTRDIWGKYVIGGILGILALWLSWQILYERPRLNQQEAQRIELTERIPNSLKNILSGIEAEAKSENIVTQARMIEERGIRAARAKEVDRAKLAVKELETLLQSLKQEYEIRIVFRRGEKSGLWRIPKVNPNARNYYLVVEAVDSSGNILSRSVANEETGDTDDVKIWAVRVPKPVYDSVLADKSDDGIIQNRIIANKARGQLDPSWKVQVTGGTITKW